MKKSDRINPSEITINRLLTAIKVRVEDIPHFFSWKFSTLAKTNRYSVEKYHNLHKGNRCFIVANGPSLQTTDLSLLENEISFGLNRIYLNFKSSSFRPTYYVAVNDLVIEQFATEIQELDMPKFINWNKRTFFQLPNRDFLFLKPRYVFNDSFEKDIIQPIVFGATVTFVALQIAYYMGFSQVFLIGLDHNFIDKGIPNTIETRKTAVDSNHFSPQYFPKGLKWQLPDLLRSEIDYQLARDAFISDKREIFDATINGKCNIFTKTDYLSLF